MKQSQLTRAMMAYGSALSVADPIRLRFWDERGLTMAQLRLMYTILVDGDQAVGDLAQKLSVRPSTVTGLTDRLVREQLIRRSDDPSDRRVVIVTLTDEGRRVLGQIEAASRAYLDQIFARMSEDEVEELIHVLERFAEAAAEVQQRGEFRP